MPAAGLGCACHLSAWSLAIQIQQGNIIQSKAQAFPFVNCLYTNQPSILAGSPAHPCPHTHMLLALA